MTHQAEGSQRTPGPWDELANTGASGDPNRITKLGPATPGLIIEQKDYVALLNERDALREKGNYRVAEIRRLREQLAAMKAYEQDALRLNALRELMGYVECGEGCAVKMYQDDATRTFFVDVGKRSYYGNSFRAAIDAAIKENGK